MERAIAQKPQVSTVARRRQGKFETAQTLLLSTETIWDSLYTNSGLETSLYTESPQYTVKVLSGLEFLGFR